MKKEVSLFKIGGGVVNSPEAFNLFVLEVFRKITTNQKNESIIILAISAFGKTTQMIEEIIAMLEHGDEVAVELKISDFSTYLGQIAGREITEVDFPEGRRHLNLFRNKALLYQGSAISDEMNAELQQFGELVSSKIMEDMLRNLTPHKKWDYVRFLDARDFIRTTGSPLIGDVDLKGSSELFEEHMTPFAFSKRDGVLICPGYIAKSIKGEASLLGKEGSDYTAALVAYFVGRSKDLYLAEVVYFKSSSGISLDFQGNGSKIDPYVTWDEVEGLVSAGAKVIHQRAVMILKKMRQPVLVTSLENFLTNGNSTIIHFK